MAATSSTPDAPIPTAVVTGASGGIGYEIARSLAEAGYRLWIVARPSERARDAAQRLDEASPHAEGVSLAAADLSSLHDTRRLARELTAVAPRLDLLVNNAGAYVHDRRLTDDGFERTWALNHLSPFLLTHLLMGSLMASDAPRVVTTSSNAEAMGAIDLERAASGVPYSARRAYGWSKQANLHFARELARRAPDPKLHSYAFHPGFVNTGFGAGSGWLTPVIGLAQRWFGRSVEQGADTGTYLATEAPAPTPNGGFFVDRSEKRPSSGGRDEAMSVRLWERSETWVDLAPSERLPRR